MALTVKELQAAKPGNWLSDDWPRGAGTLVFRRSASGAMLAYFRYTLPDGKRDTLSIGQYDERGRDGMTLMQAREEAGKLSRLYQSGVRDVRSHLEAEQEAKNAERAATQAAAEAAVREAENRQRYTLRALCDAYVSHLEAKGKKKSAAETSSSFRCHVINAHPDIAALPANEITALQMASMVRKVREAGKERAAGILRSYLCAAFNAAKKAPFDASLPADLILFNIEHNPADSIPAIPVRAGDRTLSDDELKAYITSMTSDLTDQALKLALYSGSQRIAQLLRAKVSDYDAPTQTLRLWDSKGRRSKAREHLIPLGPIGAEIVAQLIERAIKMEQVRAEDERREPGNNLFLISSHGRVAMTASTPGNRVTEIAAAMKGEPFDLRDVRRTVETMLARMKVSSDVRAQLQSHGLSGVQSKHYDRHSYFDEKRAALITLENRLEEIRTGKKANNVVKMRRKAKGAG